MPCSAHSGNGEFSTCHAAGCLYNKTTHGCSGFFIEENEDTTTTVPSTTTGITQRECTKDDASDCSQGWKLLQCETGSKTGFEKEIAEYLQAACPRLCGLCTPTVTTTVTTTTATTVTTVTTTTATTRNATQGTKGLPDGTVQCATHSGHGKFITCQSAGCAFDTATNACSDAERCSAYSGNGNFKTCQAATRCVFDKTTHICSPACSAYTRYQRTWWPPSGNATFPTCKAAGCTWDKATKACIAVAGNIPPAQTPIFDDVYTTKAGQGAEPHLDETSKLDASAMFISIVILGAAGLVFGMYAHRSRVCKLLCMDVCLCDCMLYL